MNQDHAKDLPEDEVPLLNQDEQRRVTFDVGDVDENALPSENPPLRRMQSSIRYDQLNDAEGRTRRRGQRAEITRKAVGEIILMILFAVFAGVF